MGWADTINWTHSVCMLEAGFINENMKSFANQTLLPENQMKLKEQMKILILEFNLGISSENELGNYISFLLMKERLGEISDLGIFQNLSELYLSSGLSALSRFVLLYKAKIVLNETGEQSIWTESDLTLDNVDSYLISYL